MRSRILTCIFALLVCHGPCDRQVEQVTLAVDNSRFSVELGAGQEQRLLHKANTEVPERSSHQPRSQMHVSADIQRHSEVETSGCPLVRKVEADYKYVKTVINILDSIGTPYFLTGGSGMALLRVGAVSIHPDPKSERRFAFDNDLDFFAVTKGEEEFKVFCATFQKKCEETYIFKTCGSCAATWPATGTNMSVPGKEGIDPDVRIFDVRKNADGALQVGWPHTWIIKHDTIFPLGKAKYYDVKVPVVHRPLEFFSNAIPFSSGQASPEYGSGCSAMAYPAWLWGHSEWGSTAAHERQVPSLSISPSILEQCAKALENDGFASFSECFGPGTSTFREALPSPLLPIRVFGIVVGIGGFVCIAVMSWCVQSKKTQQSSFGS